MISKVILVANTSEDLFKIVAARKSPQSETYCQSKLGLYLYYTGEKNPVPLSDILKNKKEIWISSQLFLRSGVIQFTITRQQQTALSLDVNLKAQASQPQLIDIATAGPAKLAKIIFDNYDRSLEELKIVLDISCSASRTFVNNTAGNSFSRRFCEYFQSLLRASKFPLKKIQVEARGGVVSNINRDVVFGLDYYNLFEFSAPKIQSVMVEQVFSDLIYPYLECYRHPYDLDDITYEQMKNSLPVMNSAATEGLDKTLINALFQKSFNRPNMPLNPIIEIKKDGAQVTLQEINDARVITTGPRGRNNDLIGYIQDFDDWPSMKDFFSPTEIKDAGDKLIIDATNPRLKQLKDKQTILANLSTENRLILLIVAYYMKQLPKDAQFEVNFKDAVTNRFLRDKLYGLRKIQGSEEFKAIQIKERDKITKVIPELRKIFDFAEAQKKDMLVKIYSKLELFFKAQYRVFITYAIDKINEVLEIPAIKSHSNISDLLAYNTYSTILGQINRINFDDSNENLSNQLSRAIENLIKFHNVFELSIRSRQSYKNISAQVFDYWDKIKKIQNFIVKYRNRWFLGKYQTSRNIVNLFSDSMVKTKDLTHQSAFLDRLVADQRTPFNLYGQAAGFNFLVGHLFKNGQSGVRVLQKLQAIELIYYMIYIQDENVVSHSKYLSTVRQKFQAYFYQLKGSFFQLKKNDANAEQIKAFPRGKRQINQTNASIVLNLINPAKLVVLRIEGEYITSQKEKITKMHTVLIYKNSNNSFNYFDACSGIFIDISGNLAIRKICASAFAFERDTKFNGALFLTFVDEFQQIPNLNAKFSDLYAQITKITESLDNPDISLSIKEEKDRLQILQINDRRDKFQKCYSITQELISYLNATIKIPITDPAWRYNITNRQIFVFMEDNYNLMEYFKSEFNEIIAKNKSNLQITVNDIILFGKPWFEEGLIKLSKEKQQYDISLPKSQNRDNNYLLQEGNLQIKIIGYSRNKGDLTMGNKKMADIYKGLENILKNISTALRNSVTIEIIGGEDNYEDLGRQMASYCRKISTVSNSISCSVKSISKNFSIYNYSNNTNIVYFSKDGDQILGQKQMRIYSLRKLAFVESNGFTFSQPNNLSLQNWPQQYYSSEGASIDSSTQLSDQNILYARKSLPGVEVNASLEDNLLLQHRIYAQLVVLSDRYLQYKSKYPDIGNFQLDVFTMLKDKDTATVTYYDPDNIWRTKPGVIKLNQFPELLPLMTDIAKAKASFWGYDMLIRAFMDSYRTDFEKSRKVYQSLLKLYPSLFGVQTINFSKFFPVLLALKNIENSQRFRINPVAYQFDRSLLANQVFDQWSALNLPNVDIAKRLVLNNFSLTKIQDLLTLFDRPQLNNQNKITNYESIALLSTSPLKNNYQKVTSKIFNIAGQKCFIEPASQQEVLNGGSYIFTSNTKNSTIFINKFFSGMNIQLKYASTNPNQYRIPKSWTIVINQQWSLKDYFLSNNGSQTTIYLSQKITQNPGKDNIILTIKYDPQFAVTLTLKGNKLIKSISNTANKQGLRFTNIELSPTELGNYIVSPIGTQIRLDLGKTFFADNLSLFNIKNTSGHKFENDVIIGNKVAGKVMMTINGLEQASLAGRPFMPFVDFVVLMVFCPLATPVPEFKDASIVGLKINSPMPAQSTIYLKDIYPTAKPLQFFFSQQFNEVEIKSNEGLNLKNELCFLTTAVRGFKDLAVTKVEIIKNYNIDKLSDIQRQVQAACDTGQIYLNDINNLILRVNDSFKVLKNQINIMEWKHTLKSNNFFVEIAIFNKAVQYYKCLYDIEFIANVFEIMQVRQAIFPSIYEKMSRQINSSYITSHYISVPNVRSLAIPTYKNRFELSKLPEIRKKSTRIGVEFLDTKSGSILVVDARSELQNPICLTLKKPDDKQLIIDFTGAVTEYGKKAYFSLGQNAYVFEGTKKLMIVRNADMADQPECKFTFYTSQINDLDTVFRSAKPIVIAPK